jgi:hypothetical protein
LHRWFDKVENALLRALRPDFASEPATLLTGLELDTAVYGDDPVENEMTRLLADGLQAALARDSWWWSIGGGAFPVQARRYQGLPDPYKFSAFITSDTERQGGALV